MLMVMISKYHEVGFRTIKPFNEDTGFLVYNTPPSKGVDKVAILKWLEQLVKKKKRKLFSFVLLSISA